MSYPRLEDLERWERDADAFMDRIERAIRRHHISQRQLALTANLDPKNVNPYFVGRSTPSLSTMWRLDLALRALVLHRQADFPEFRDWIRHNLDKHKIKQVKLARAAGISAAQICRYLAARGPEPSAETRDKIERALIALTIGL